MIFTLGELIYLFCSIGLFMYSENEYAFVLEVILLQAATLLVVPKLENQFSLTLFVLIFSFVIQCVLLYRLGGF